jgi:hypothetical protein
LNGFLKVFHLNGEMSHAHRDLFVVDHEVELASGPREVPVPGEVEGGPFDGLETQDVTVKAPTPFKVPNNDRDVMKILDLDHGLLPPLFSFTVSIPSAHNA